MGKQRPVRPAFALYQRGLPHRHGRAPDRLSVRSATTDPRICAPVSIAMSARSARFRPTTPDAFENLLIQPLAVGGASYDASPADIHAYDVRTGKLAWVFHTIPHPGEFGYETWPEDAWKTSGGVHNWNEMTLDEKRGIAYIPLGRPATISMARIAMAQISLAIPCSLSTPAPANDCGTSKPSITTCGITIFRPRRSFSPCATKARMSMPSRSQRNKASCSYLIASPASLCGRLKSAPCRSPMCLAKSPGRRSLFPPNLHRSRASRLPKRKINPYLTEEEQAALRERLKSSATRVFSRRPACAAPSRCRATTAAPTGAVRRWTPSKALCTSCPKNCRWDSSWNCRGLPAQAEEVVADAEDRRLQMPRPKRRFHLCLRRPYHPCQRRNLQAVPPQEALRTSFTTTRLMTSCSR